MTSFSCPECQDSGRASLAQEIVGVLKSRGLWTPKITDFHNKRQTCDIIGAVAMAIGKLDCRVAELEEALRVLERESRIQEEIQKGNNSH